MRSVIKWFCGVCGEEKLISFERIWSTTMRCSRCHGVLYESPPGTIMVYKEEPA